MLSSWLLTMVIYILLPTEIRFSKSMQPCLISHPILHSTSVYPIIYMDLTSSTETFLLPIPISWQEPALWLFITFREILLSGSREELAQVSFIKINSSFLSAKTIEDTRRNHYVFYGFILKKK